MALVVIPHAELATLAEETRSAFEEAFQSVRASLNSDESLRAYQREWGNFLSFLTTTRRKSVLNARTGDVQAYLESLRAIGLKLASRARALSVIRVVYGSLVRFDVMAQNPAREAKNPKSSTDRKTPVLTEPELRQLIQLVPGPEADFGERRDYLITLTASYTGLRRSNLATIAIDKFTPTDDGSDWLVAVRVKGDKLKVARVIKPLADALFAWCREHDITTGAIFRASATATNAISVGTVRNALKNQAARAKIQNIDKVSPHTFRRTFASMAKRRGASVFDIQRDLMHSRVSTTEGYLKYVELPSGLGHSFEDLLPETLRRT